MFKSALTYLFLVLLLQGVFFAQEKTIISLETEEEILPFRLVSHSVVNLPKVGVALSGGGSRGLAQIGILRALEQNNIPIDVIVGTSMGSIIGGLYSAGYTLEALDSIVQAANWAEFMSANETNRNELFIDQKITEDRAIITLRLDGFNPILPTSVSSGHKISNFFTLLTLNAPIHIDKSFDELLFDFRAVSTDLVSGKKVVLQNGSLSQSMRASSSVSFFLAPVKADSMLLVDGGLVSNIPVETAREMGCDYVIAINTTAPLRNRRELDYPWNVADQIVSVPMKRLEEEELRGADYIISPDLPVADSYEFRELKTIIDAGNSYSLEDDSLQNSLYRLYTSALAKENYSINKLIPGGSSVALEESVINNFGDKNPATLGKLYLNLLSLIRGGDFEEIYFELEKDSAASVLNIHSVLNPALKKITVVTNEDYIRDLANPSLQGLENTIYNGRKILNQLLICLRKFRSAGFSLIDIEKTDFDRASGELKIYFTDGRVDDIIIEGNERTKKESVLREIPLKRGDLFRYNDIEAGLTNLRSTNLFEEVETILQKNGRRNVIKIRLVERHSQLIRFGFMADNERQTFITLDIRDENFLGTGTELGAILSAGARNRAAILEHKVNRIFDTYLTYKLRAFYGFDDIYVYREKPSGSERRFENERTAEYRYVYSGASFALGTQVRKLGNLIAEIKYLNDIIKNKIDYTGTTYSNDLFSLKLALNIDSQDRFPYPTSGLKLNTFYETAQALLAGDVGYSKFSVEYQGFISLNQNITVSPRFALGFADETLPLSQQFSFGGQYSFFGFRENEYRGRQIFISSIEYRYKLPIKLFFDTYLRARYDLGSSWAQPEDIKFKDFKHGIGLTLSLDTPIGPADFSVAKGFLVKKVISDNIISWGETTFYFNIGYYY